MGSRCDTPRKRATLRVDPIQLLAGVGSEPGEVHDGHMVSYLTNTPIGQGDGDVPLFLQVAQRISDDIVDGTLAEGDQVPSINEFATFWRINPATALKGVGQLVSDGVLYKQRGIGTFVADGARAQLVKQRQAEFADRYLKPLIAEAARLGISATDLAALIKEEA